MLGKQLTANFTISIRHSIPMPEPPARSTHAAGASLAHDPGRTCDHNLCCPLPEALKARMVQSTTTYLHPPSPTTPQSASICSICGSNPSPQTLRSFA